MFKICWKWCLQGCKTTPRLILGTSGGPKVHRSGYKGCPMRLHMSNQVPPGKPKGAQRRPKETQEATKIKRNDPRGTERGPRKNPKVKLQYYLVNNTIQEAKLQYYLVNNTIQKTVFYGFS
jgi:hypothetical protein